VRRKIVGLCEGSAFHEYFDLESAAGHDSVLFSWFVALLLYVLLTFHQRRREDAPGGKLVVFRVGVSQFTTMPWDFERDVKEYAALGVEAIEVCEEKLAEGQATEQLALAGQSGYRGAYTLEILSQDVPDSLWESGGFAAVITESRECLKRAFREASASSGARG
jgi:hypothetical protein